MYNTIKLSIRQILPQFIKRQLIILFRWWWYLKQSIHEQHNSSDHNIPLPPLKYRYRVSGTGGARETFLARGKSLAMNLEAALTETGIDKHQLNDVLEWGVGCGRVMRWLQDWSTHATLHGCDIDSEMIAWDMQNIDFAKFKTNSLQPPLPYPENSFDLIFSVSVLTHLDEELQDAWLRELQRVAKPDAILLLSIHGEHLWHEKPDQIKLPAQVEQFEQRGFVFVQSHYWHGIFEDFYGDAYHSKQYICEHWGQYFEILDNKFEGVGHQNLIIARNSLKA